MPQMKPMNWILLFILMNMILIFMNIMNYYLFNFSMMNNKKIIKKQYKSWKW